MLNEVNHQQSPRFRVGFFSRGKLGYQVLKKLLNDPKIEIPIIVTCRHTPEVGYTELDFKELAENRNIPFYITNSLNKPNWVELIRPLNLDLGLGMQWINTIGAAIISETRLGFLNLHGGKLPRYRGNACSNWAILNGEEEQGLCVHLMEPGRLDSGPIILQERFPIKSDTYIEEIMDHFISRGQQMIIEAVDLLALGKATIESQPETGGLYCYPRLPRDGEIDWTKPAEQIYRLVRAAGKPYPGAYSYYSDIKDSNCIKKLIIWKGHIEEHPGDFCAVPGHVLRLEANIAGQVGLAAPQTAVVCGDGKLLILDDISINGHHVDASDTFRSVRQRLGLNTEQLLSEIGSLQEQIKHLSQQLSTLQSSGEYSIR
ncbi:MAG: methionyl-tRNA formyltransferase [Candidatus Melainabacteria bacterium]|nr:methionyl-tRNA formyltransferase [Candidatus Melainabacteria bacterium]